MTEQIKLQMSEELRKQLAQLVLLGTKISGAIDALRMTQRCYIKAMGEILRMEYPEFDFEKTEYFYHLSENCFYVKQVVEDEK